MQPIFPPTMKITGIDNSGSITFYLPFHDCFEKNRAKYDSKFFKTAFDLCRLYNFFYSLMFAHLFFFSKGDGSTKQRLLCYYWLISTQSNFGQGTVCVFQLPDECLVKTMTFKIIHHITVNINRPGTLSLHICWLV